MQPGPALAGPIPDAVDVPVVALATQAGQACPASSLAAACAVSTVTDQLLESNPAKPPSEVNGVKVHVAVRPPPLGGAGAAVPVTVPTATPPLLPWAAHPSGPSAPAGELARTTTPSDASAKAAP